MRTPIRIDANDFAFFFCFIAKIIDRPFHKPGNFDLIIWEFGFKILLKLKRFAGWRGAFADADAGGVAF